MIEQIKQIVLNLKDTKLSRKIVVIQSDDWGSIRMPSEMIRTSLNNHDLIDASDPYARFDSIAGSDDLNALFEVLNSVKDKHGNPANLTANSLSANPNFDKIKASQFNEYFYESLEDSFEFHKRTSALKMWDEGISNKLFTPQYHGREHVNIPFWLQKLKEGHKGVLYAFEHNVFGVDFNDLGESQINFQRAWDQIVPEGVDLVNDAILEGYNMFSKRFGFKSTTATPPNYTWTKEQEKMLFDNGVESLQGILRNRIRNTHNFKYEYEIRHSGLEKKVAFQRRNVFFEPSMLQSKEKKNLLNVMFKRIGTAFILGRPVIIGSHRLNYIGSLSEDNRINNLKLLKTFLTHLVIKWPDVEFMSADQLNSSYIKNIK